MSPFLAGFAGLFAFAAAWELAGAGAPVALRRLRGRALGVKAAGVTLGLVAGVLVVPVAPQRLGPPLVLLLAVAGLLAPDALVERAARRRSARLVAALPEALDLLAVGAAPGRAPAALFSELAAGTAGPLAAELALTVADIECGSPQADALQALRGRAGAPEVGALTGALERSRRFGSPLAEQLHAQATALRRDERRRVEERASRAAPKIQLVVAMVLVPSVLLTIVAALVAHSDALFGAL